MNEYYKGKTAWVTGSSRRLGRCIAEMLAEAGCNVVISGRNQTNLQSSGEGNSVDDAAAKKDPDKYKSIRVRVSGFSAPFVNLEEAIQDNVIARTVGSV